MRVPVPGSLAAALALLLAACGDRPNPLPTGVEADFSRGPAEGSALQARIKVLVNQLFPQPERRDALALSAQVQRGVASGDLALASRALAGIVRLAGTAELRDPPGPETAGEGAERLVLLLGEFTGLDVGVQEVGAGGGTATADSEEAGVFVPPGALDDDALVVVHEVVESGSEHCLPTARLQRDGCYEFETIPAQPGGFNAPVTVGICVDVTGLTSEQADRLRLYAFHEGDPNVRALPNAAVTFLDCSESVATLDGREGHFGRLARAGWRAFREHVGPFFAPAPLHAIDVGLGGLVGSFSRIGWAASTVLVYGPSLTPRPPWRPHNERTLAEDEGHFVTVVDAATWSGMSATGPGGFGDFDAIVFGDGGDLAALAAAEANSATWSPAVSGRIVVSTIHAGVHQCDLSHPDCQSRNAEQFHNPEARQLIRQAIDWVATDTLPGLYAATGVRHQGVAPPGVSIDPLSGFGSFEAVGLAPPIFFLSGAACANGTCEEDVVDVLDSSHPVLDGLTGPDFSGWFTSYHQFLSAVPSDFTVLAVGFRDEDNFFDAGEGVHVPGPLPVEPLPVLVVRP